MVASLETIKQISTALHIDRKVEQADGSTKTEPGLVQVGKDVYLTHWFKTEAEADNAMKLLETLDPSQKNFIDFNTIAYKNYVKGKGWEVYIEGNVPNGDFSKLAVKDPASIEKIIGNGLADIIERDTANWQRAQDARKTQAEAEAKREEVRKEFIGTATTYKAAFDTKLQEEGVKNGLSYESQTDAFELSQKINNFKVPANRNVGALSTVRQEGDRWVVDLNANNMYNYREDRPADAIFDMVKAHRDAVDSNAATKKPLVEQLEAKLGVKTELNQEVYRVAEPPMTPGEAKEVAKLLNNAISGVAWEEKGKLMINERVLNDKTFDTLNFTKLGSLGEAKNRLAGIGERVRNEKAAHDTAELLNDALSKLPGLKQDATDKAQKAVAESTAWGKADADAKLATQSQAEAQKKYDELKVAAGKDITAKDGAATVLQKAQGDLTRIDGEVVVARKAATEAQEELAKREKTLAENKEEAKKTELTKQVEEAKTTKKEKDGQLSIAEEHQKSAKDIVTNLSASAPQLEATAGQSAAARDLANTALTAANKAVTDTAAALDTAKKAAEAATLAANTAIGLVNTAQAALPALHKNASEAAGKANAAPPAALPATADLKLLSGEMIAPAAASANSATPQAGQPAQAGASSQAAQQPAPQGNTQPNSAQPAPGGNAAPADQAQSAGETSASDAPPPESSAAPKPGGTGASAPNFVDDNKWGMMGMIGSGLLMAFMGMDMMWIAGLATLIGGLLSATMDPNGLAASNGMNLTGKDKNGPVALHIDGPDGKPIAIKPPELLINKDGQIVTELKEASYVLSGASKAEDGIKLANYQDVTNGVASEVKPLPKPITFLITPVKDGNNMVYAVARATNLKETMSSALTPPAAAPANTAAANPLTDLDKNKDGILSKEELSTLNRNPDKKLRADDGIDQKLFDQILAAAPKTPDGKVPTEIDLGTLPSQTLKDGSKIEGISLGK